MKEINGIEWQIDFHKRALKFFETNKIPESEIIEIIVKAPKRFKGEDINIDIAKLKGVWAGFHRIKIGNMRIIAEFNFDKKRVYIENIDWRDRVYKK
jgi:mRNA-degrading endonuclease RelE of RelBE toxin-antitoxin system